jgi:hypothetical protein
MALSENLFQLYGTKPQTDDMSRNEENTGNEPVCGCNAQTNADRHVPPPTPTDHAESHVRGILPDMPEEKGGRTPTPIMGGENDVAYVCFAFLL